MRSISRVGVNLEIINEELSSVSIEVPSVESKQELSSVSADINGHNQRNTE